MVHLRSFVFALVMLAGAGAAAAQPRPDLGSPAPAGRTPVGPATSTVWPKPCVTDVLKAAQWFVRELDEGKITVEEGPGWRAYRGTTVDSGETLPVLWVKLEAIDPSSKSAGAVSGWIEVSGAPDGMAPGAMSDDQAAAMPDSHYERSLGRWRLVRALVDGTPKEEALVVKALDQCAVALQKPPKPVKRARPRARGHG
ncbi:MAG TPA: hypothetical protein VHE35_19085 [Kofleriaceae bacterium]|nr:hypothetical protein [Kofleriaceae bacterium]